MRANKCATHRRQTPANIGTPTLTFPIDLAKIISSASALPSIVAEPARMPLGTADASAGHTGPSVGTQGIGHTGRLAHD